MTTINKKDIKSFGKVLEALGIALQKNPSILHGILQDADADTKEGNKEQVNVDKLAKIPLFQLAKKSPEKLENTLRELSTSELKSLLKLNHLGGSNFRAKESIINYILDQLKKRTTAVFREHNSESVMNANIKVRSTSEPQEHEK